MSWQSMRGDGVVCQPSPLESRRFGLSVGRVWVGVDTRDPRDAGDALIQFLRHAEEDLLVVRWPSQFTRLGAAAASSGRVIIPADVLSYWEVASGETRGDDAASGLTLSPATVADAATLGLIEAIVVDSFREYGNHYSANPLLDPDAALAGYVEWAQSCVTDPARDVLIASRTDEPLGVATLERSDDGADLEVLLCGLVEAAQGRGLYGPLLSGIATLACRQGCARTIISTQAHNIRAQRVWARTGFRPFAAVTTVHALARDKETLGE